MKFQHLDNAVKDHPFTPIVKAIADGLGLTTEAAYRSIPFFLNQIALLERKQLDYGPRNISDFGTPGVIIRMNDKMQRLKSLLGKKRRKPRNESVMDSLMDISNYGVIGQMTEAGEWPSGEVFILTSEVKKEEPV